MRPKRLIFIAPAPLSPTPYCESALPALARDGWEVTLAAIAPESSALRKVLPYSCRIIDLGSGDGLRRWLRELRLLLVILRARIDRFDVIYLQSNGLAARALPLMLVPMLRRSLVYQTLELVDPVRYPWRAWFEKWLCRRAHLHLNAEYHRAYIYWTYYRLRSPVIVAPPRLPACWPVPNKSPGVRLRLTNGDPGSFVLIHHGGSHTHRMTDELLAAFSKLPARFRLVMTGAARTALERVTAKLGLAERVLLLPSIDMATQLLYTANADAGLLLYRNTDLGNFFACPGRLGEYTACGLPVLASNFTGLEDLVLRFQLGECVDAADPEEIVHGILKLEQGAKEGRYERERIRNCFLKHLAFDHYEPAICEAFDNLLNPARRRRAAGPPRHWIPGT